MTNTDNKDLAKSNRDFAEKEWKNSTLFEKIMTWVIRLGTIAIAIIVTLFLYVWPEPCTIDKEFAWCHTHPFTVLDLIGTIIFYVGCIWLGGIGPWISINIFGMDDDQDVQKPLAWGAFAAALLGIVLIWI